MRNCKKNGQVLRRGGVATLAGIGLASVLACQSGADTAAGKTQPSGTATTSGSSSGSGGASAASVSASQTGAVQSVVASSAATGAGGGSGECSPAPTPGSFYALEDTRLSDVKPSSMCKYTGQVLFVFNAAELCGYTSQTTAIQALQVKYAAKGLTILGFYSDDFNQGGDPKACNAKFGVTFDTFELAPVKGANARPVFAWFGKKTSPGPEPTSEPQWNFSKYLVARDGTWAKHWSHPTVPDAKEVTDAIEAELAKK